MTDLKKYTKDLFDKRLKALTEGMDVFALEQVFYNKMSYDEACRLYILMQIAEIKNDIKTLYSID